MAMNALHFAAFAEEACSILVRIGYAELIER